MQEENRELLTDFAFRLSAAAGREGLSQTEIAERLGLKLPRVSNWFQGRNFPRKRERVELAKVLRTNVDWLIQGKGDPEIISENPQAPYSAVREIPVISWTHAGEAGRYEEMPKHFHGTVATTSRDPKAFALTIEGDSMEPKFLQGDRVVLEPLAPLINGKPVVAKFADDGVKLRIYHRERDGKIRLTSLRPEIYPPDVAPISEFIWIWPVKELVRSV